jgi:WhiB family transcriptional regulator, redox-sensing transcriptional regulator
MTASSPFSEWWLRAACTAAEADLFFPISSHAANADVTAAKQVCAACQVRGECLEYAIQTHQVHGIWGGTTEDERRLIQIRARSAA